MAYFSFLCTSVIADFDDMVENQHKNYMSLFEMVDESDGSGEDNKDSENNVFSNAEKEKADHASGLCDAASRFRIRRMDAQNRLSRWKAHM
jgi:hypothetical protein